MRALVLDGQLTIGAANMDNDNGWGRDCVLAFAHVCSFAPCTLVQGVRCCLDCTTSACFSRGEGCRVARARSAFADVEQRLLESARNEDI